MNKLKNKRIIVSICTLDLGGAERQALLLANYLQNTLGNTVKVIAFGEGNGNAVHLLNKYNLNYEIVKINLGSQGFKLKLNLLKLIFAIIRFRAQILLPYAYWPNVYFNAIHEYTFAKVCVWNQRDGGYGLGSSSLEKKAFKNASIIISNSTEGKKSLIQYFDDIPKDIKLIFNGIEFEDSKEDKNIIREKLGFDKDEFIAIMVANLTHIKDHATLIEAWSKFNEQYKSKSKLLLVGRKDNTYEAVMEKIKEYNLEENVIITGFVEDVRSYIKASDLCVFSSNSEGVPNGILECMSESLPVVATHIDGSTDALGEDYKYLVPIKSPGLFAEYILQFANDTQLRNEVGLSLKNRINQKFSIEQMCENYNQLLSNYL